jgi:hypothetical protein
MGSNESKETETVESSSQEPEPRTVLLVQSDRDVESHARLADLIETLDGLVVPSLWAAVAVGDRDDHDLRMARKALMSAAQSARYRIPFFPPLAPGFSLPRISLVGALEDRFGRYERYGPPPEPEPLNVGVQVGMNGWIRRTLRDDVPDAYDRLFSFAVVRRIEHRSPIVIESLIVTTGVAGATLYKIVSSAYKLRQQRAETRMKEQERAAKEEAVPEQAEQERQRTRQERARTRYMEAQAEIQETVARAVSERASARDIDVDAIAREVAAATAPAVNDLIETPFSRFEIGPGDPPEQAM